MLWRNSTERSRTIGFDRPCIDVDRSNYMLERRNANNGSIQYVLVINNSENRWRIDIDLLANAHFDIRNKVCFGQAKMKPS